MRLKKLLAETGTSQQKLADDLGLSIQSVNYYVHEKREPSIATLIKMADYFHVTVDYLVGRDVKPESPYTGEQIVVDPEKPVKLRVNNRTIEIILAEERDR